LNGKIVRILVYLLVLVNLAAVFLMMAYIAGGANAEILTGFEIFVLGTGLSALTLAVLARDSRPQGVL
jgi:hypothetical protein